MPAPRDRRLHAGNKTLQASAPQSNFKRMANGRLSMKDQGLPPPAFVAPPIFDHAEPTSPPPLSPAPMSETLTERHSLGSASPLPAPPPATPPPSQTAAVTGP